MHNDPLSLLQRLIETPTPSGWELPGQRLLADYVRPYADSVRLDTHGSLHAVLNPSAPVRFMLAGHCDEIGLIVEYIDEKGFVYASPIGGLNIQLLPGERVVFRTADGRRVPGVIGRKAIHQMSAEERSAGVKQISDLWIDIGASSRAEALEALPVGTPGVVDSGWRPLLGDTVSARAFDDRVGAVVVMDVLRRLKGRKINVALHVVATTQEELGLLGAQTAAYAVDPHAGIAVDVTFATDDPSGDPKRLGRVALGAGPAVAAGPSYDHGLSQTLLDTAKSSDIPVQTVVKPRANGTDSFALRLARAGVANGLVGIPLRYMHSAVETLRLSDVENASQLLADTIASFPADVQFGPKL